LNSPTARFAHGDAISRLADVLRLASFRWKQRISPQDVADATGLDRKTVWQMAREDPATQPVDYYFRTLRLLCWYFGCDIADLLLWVPPTQMPGLPPDPVLRRNTPPATPPPQNPTLHCTIPARLKGRRRADIARATGLRYQTVTDLLDEAHPPTRISRRTLAALCDYLSGDGSFVGPGDLLSCSAQEEAQEHEESDSPPEG
jgi:DNA-binding Xre family transcriptional regulator